MSLRAHYVSASQRLATSRLSTDAICKSLQSTADRRAKAVAYRRARLAVAREVQAVIKFRRETAGDIEKVSGAESEGLGVSSLATEHPFLTRRRSLQILQNMAQDQEYIQMSKVSGREMLIVHFELFFACLTRRPFLTALTSPRHAPRALSGLSALGED